MRVLTTLKTLMGVFLLLSFTTSYGAVSLHDAHDDGEIVGGEGLGNVEVCTWHFVHNQIPKVNEDDDGKLTATFNPGEVVVEVNHSRKSKKVRHYLVDTTGVDVSLFSASSDVGDTTSGKLVLSGEPFCPEPVCPCEDSWLTAVSTWDDHVSMPPVFIAANFFICNKSPATATRDMMFLNPQMFKDGLMLALSISSGQPLCQQGGIIGGATVDVVDLSAPNVPISAGEFAACDKFLIDNWPCS